MNGSIEERFERYFKPIVEALSHADRCQPAQWYLQRLMLPGERKSVEPMARLPRNRSSRPRLRP